MITLISLAVSAEMVFQNDTVSQLYAYTHTTNSDKSS